MNAGWRAAALDLGSTRLKLGALHADGSLEVLAVEPFPQLELDGERCEIDTDVLLRSATRLFERIPAGVPLGIASQRSSFALWDRGSGELAGPALSWRDRRAAPWCASHGELEREVVLESRLPFSPHYAAAKLAQRFEDDAALAARARAGELCFGTLETFLLWHWSGRSLHVTDPTMAARTQLADPLTASWSERALERFGVPRALLPEIRPACGRDETLLGDRRLGATLADQAAALLATAPEGDVLVNMGTGTFVMCVDHGRPWQRRYPYGPVLWCGGRRVFAHEGTVNGGSATLARFADVELPARPPEPLGDLFASPDESGLGAPRWRADATLRFSRDESLLPPAAALQAFLEGLAFRVREICDDIAPRAARVLLSGGLAHQPYLAEALASVLAPRRVELADQGEATLLGAARLAAGLPPCEPSANAPLRPARGNQHRLRAKYRRWRAWMDAQWP